MICRELVTASGGSISVHSEGKMKGSTFSFTMAMSRVAGEEDRVSMKSDSERNSNGQLVPDELELSASGEDPAQSKTIYESNV